MSATSTTLHYLFEAKPLWTGTVGTGGVTSAAITTIPLSSATGLDEGDAYVVTLGRVDSNGSRRSASLKEVIIGKVSGSNLINCVRGVEGIAQTHDAGTVIEILFTATHWNKLITAWELVADQTGRIKNEQWYAADGGANDSYAVTLTPAPSAYTAGMIVNFKANTANTGSATINVNSLGAKTIKKNYNSDLADNDIKAGQLVSVIYDGTNFQLLSPVSNASASGTAFWSDVPGTPTRVSDTQFTITDTSNTNKYDLLFKKGTILRWDESGTFQTGMVISSSYATNTVTINIVGDTLSIGFTLMKYAIPEAKQFTFCIPGTLATGTDMSFTWQAPQGIYILSSDAYVSTAGTTNSTVFDINVGGTTKFTTKPTITTGTTSDIDNVADTVSTEVSAGSLLTVDIDSVSTTPPQTAYITVFYYPSAWRYRS